MINSRNKGKRGELEFAKALNSLLPCQARRGQQFKGTPDSPDVIGLPGIHIEVKRTERLNVLKAFLQAVRDKSLDDIALVAHRCNRSPWLVTVQLEDLPELCKRLSGFTKGEQA